jgi:hypothetical protein
MDALIEKLSTFPRLWDGKTCVERMLQENYHWRQSEWTGFFFQLLCRDSLGDIMEIPGRRYDTGDFDAFFVNDWDFKTHTASISGIPRKSSEVILNDLETINQSLDRYGKVHFLIATGDATMDLDGSFKAWHNELKGGVSDYVRDRIERGAPSRPLKTAFKVESIEIFEINERNRGLLKVFSQGRNSNGRARPLKYSLLLERISGDDRTKVA